MLDSQGKPVLMVFAGPNGSGKTTLTHGLPLFGTYINTDDLKNGYLKTFTSAYWIEESLRMLLGV